MLKAKLTSLDGIDDSLKAHYTQKDGAFVLDVEAVEGFALEDVSGLRKVLDEVKAERTTLKGQLSDLESELGRSKLSITELESTQDAKAKEKIAEYKQKYEAELKELHQKEMQTKDETITNLKQEVEGLRLDDVAKTELLNAGFTKNGIELIMPVVKKSTKMVQAGDGHKVEIVNELGHVRSGEGGRDMTMAELCAELAPKYPELVQGSGSNGAGAGAGGGSGAPNVGGKIVPLSEMEKDPKAFAVKMIDPETGKPREGVTVDTNS